MRRTINILPPVALTLTAAVFVALLCVDPPASAQPVRTRYSYPVRTAPAHHDTLLVVGGGGYGGHTHVPNTVRRREVVRIVEVAQINPAYLSAYSPEGYDAVTQAQILGEIQRLTARLDQLQGLLKNPMPTAGTTGAPAGGTGNPAPGAGGAGTPPPAGTVPVPGGPLVVPPTPGPTSAMTILRTHCAACHQAGKLLPDQKFTLLDAKGDLVTLTDKQRLRIVQKTRTSQMPPPSNTFGIAQLTDIEFAAVADLMGQ